MRRAVVVFLLALSFGLMVWTCVDFFVCVIDEEGCSFAHDFEVFYAPVWNLANGFTATLYPVHPAYAWLHALPGAPMEFHFSFYPPHTFVLLYFLSKFSYAAALPIWFLAQFVILALSLNTAYMRKVLIADDATGTAVAVYIMLLYSVVPVAGQISLFCAALFFFILSWRQTRPFLAGVALGLLTIKPQLGILLPLLLIYERNWRVLAVAAATAALLAALSVAFWGMGVWRDYLHMIALSSELLAVAPIHLIHVAASPYMEMRLLHIGPYIASLLQAAVTAFCLVAFYAQLCLENPSENKRVMMLCLVSFLLSPYMFVYDTPILALPCILLLRRWGEKNLSGRAVIGLIYLVFLPAVAIRLQNHMLPYSFIALMTTFLIVLTSPSDRQAKEAEQ